jgi:chorismate binding enzyme
MKPATRSSRRWRRWHRRAQDPAVEITESLEREPRGVYCGAIGGLAPDGQAAFNVRTLTLKAGETVARLGHGSEIIADSRRPTNGGNVWPRERSWQAGSAST